MLALVDDPTMELFDRPSHGRRDDTSKIITIAGKQLKTTPVFDAYWFFAAERQRMFFRRLRRSNQPRVTNDPILATYRFTNSYRASDRVSQFLIKNVIYADGAPDRVEDRFFRIMLFKLFNKIETWQALEATLGPIEAASFDYSKAERLLEQRRADGVRNYSAAYIMPSCGKRFDRATKHAGHLALLRWMLAQAFPQRIADARSMSDAYHLLLSAPSIGPFLAYQFVTDLNYSILTDFTEREFVVAGPGALDGIAKCFVDSSDVAPEDIIRFMMEHQRAYFSTLDQPFEDLWGRPLQLIDCQNVFCEISKYARVAFPEVSGVSGRTRIKQRYRSAGPIQAPVYPPKWQLNEPTGLGYDPASPVSSG